MKNSSFKLKDIIFALPLLILLFAGTVASEEPTALQVDPDFGVPDSPAFAALNLTPSKILAPKGTRELVTSILNAQDNNGNFKQGIAIDTSFLNLFGRDSTLDDYRHGVNDIFFRTRLSFAVAKGQEAADKSSRLSMGLNFSPIDDGDLRLLKTTDDCYKKLIQNAEKKYPAKDLIKDFMGNPVEWKKYSDSRDANIKKEISSLLPKSDNICGLADNLNKQRLSFGVAPKWFSKNGDTDNFELEGGSFWGSYSIGLKEIPGKTFGAKDFSFDSKDIVGDFLNKLQLVLHSRYFWGEKVPQKNVNGVFFDQDSFLAGGKIQTAGKSWLASFESSYNVAYPKLGKPDESYMYAFNFEKKVIQDFWVEFSVGSHTGRSLQNNDVFGSVNLKGAKNLMDSIFK